MQRIVAAWVPPFGFGESRVRIDFGPGDRADYTAPSEAGNRNCRNPPTRAAQASSLCSAALDNFKMQIAVRATSLSCKAHREIVRHLGRYAALRACRYPARCAGADVLQRARQSGEPIRDPTRRMAKARPPARRHADSGAPHRESSRPPSDEPPKPVCHGSGSTRKFDSMSGRNSSMIIRIYRSALPPPRRPERVGVYSRSGFCPNCKCPR